MSNKHTILVTGTGGFIGGRVAEAIYLNNFGKVRAGIKRWPSAARIARFPIEIVMCDVMDNDQIAQAMSGVNVVVHCAYNNSKEVITQGTRNMLNMSKRLDVQRFIYLSSAEIYGTHVSGQIDETYPYKYSDNEYADSKIEAEKLCWEFYEKGLPVTILRPSIVYGIFSERIIRFAERIQSGNWRVFEEYGEGKCNLVYVDDLVSAILLAIKQKTAVGEAFNINGPEIATWNQFFERLNDALGLPKLNTIPSGKATFKSAARDRASIFTGFFMDRFGDLIMDVYLRGGFLSKFIKQVKNSLNTTPSIKELQNLYSRDALYIDSKAKKLLSYKPKFDLNAGLQMCVLWLDHHGFLRQTPGPLPNATAYRQPLSANE